MKNIEIHSAQFYLVSFEDLVPRLQTYFSLDRMRRKIQDFTASEESIRVCSLLGTRIQSAQTQQDFSDISHAITSYPWYGFKEKDNALKLILSLWEQADKSAELKAHMEDIKKDLLYTVYNIGYPSQFIHLAQIDKIKLRNTSKITQIANKPNHKRFEEAWMILSTKDYSFSNSLENKKIIKLLHKSMKNSQMTSNEFVMSRIIDTIMEVALLNIEQYKDDVSILYSKILEEFISHQVSESTICLVLDRLKYIEQSTGVSIQLTHKSLDQLKLYIDLLEQRYTTEFDRVELFNLQSRVNF